MILLASRVKPSSIGKVLVGLVARAPARVQTKLLVAFLTIAALLIAVGVVAIRAVSHLDDETQELIRLEHEIAAYRQVQHDTTNQLYGVANALLFPEGPSLDAALRQLNQFGYDLNRLQFVAGDQSEVIAQVRETYERLIASVYRVVELVRAGRTEKPGMDR